MVWARIGVALGMLATTISLGAASAHASPGGGPEGLIAGPTANVVIVRGTTANPMTPHEQTASATNADFAGLLGSTWYGRDKVTTAFTVPRLACTKRNRVMVIDAGIESELNSNLAAWPAITLACYRDKAVYIAGLHFGTKTTYSSKVIVAGNKLTLDTTETDYGFTNLSITNHTRHWTIKQHDGYVDDASFPLIVEFLEQFRGQGGRAQVPVFTRIVFHNTYADGLALQNYPFEPVNMSSGGLTRITVANSSPINEAGFTSTFRHT